MTITPKNWGTFQHYKDRAPTWIKLHCSLLDDADFQRLQVASRALAPMLWLLASRYDGGEITASNADIAWRLRMPVEDFERALIPLIEHGFFIMEQDASNALAERYQLACPEREKEERQRQNADAASAAGSGANAPHLTVVAATPAADKLFFDQAVTYLGASGRGLAAKLLKAKSGNVQAAHAALLTAAQKSEPREYIGRIIAGKDDGDRFDNF